MLTHRKTPESVIAALVHELVKVQRFAEMGDLVESVKRRCARLRIPYDGGLVTEAIRSVSRTRPVLADAPQPERIRHEVIADSQQMSREDASRLLAKIRSR